MESVREVSLRVGQSVRLPLPNAASAGYQWFVRNDCERAVRAELQYEASNAGGTVMNTGVFVTLTGLACGSARIVLEQKRVFEGKIREIVRADVTVAE